MRGKGGRGRGNHLTKAGLFRTIAYKIPSHLWQPSRMKPRPELLLTVSVGIFVAKLGIMEFLCWNKTTEDWTPLITNAAIIKRTWARCIHLLSSQPTSLQFSKIIYAYMPRPQSHKMAETCSKGKVIPLQVRCGPEGGWRYSSTLPWPRH